MVTTFLIQTHDGKITTIEELALMHQLKYNHGYDFILCDNSTKVDLPYSLDLIKRFVVPVGDLIFVGTFLKKYHGISHMNPIEIPKALRNAYYLKRWYRILAKKDLPKQGFYFLKSADTFKDFSTLCCIEGYDFHTSIYVVSKPITILSEWRVYIKGTVVQQVSNYAGEPLMSVDASFIEACITDIKKIPHSPKSYTLDIAITDIGPALLEIHAFCCVGNYGLFTANLPSMYMDGFEYFVKYNREIELD